MAVSGQIRQYLDSQKVSYEVLPHDQAFSARGTARALQVRDAQFAKTVILRADGRRVMAVLSSSHHINMHHLREELGASHLEMMAEGDLEVLCPGCEVGAFPPFGNLYGMEVWVDGQLSRSEWIHFNAGTHTEALRIRYTDYVRLARPHIGFFAELQE
jgi:Ala-tRNA(Pro) deacylase